MHAEPRFKGFPRVVARASHAAAAMFEHDLQEFSSNLLGRRGDGTAPGWTLPDVPLSVPRSIECKRRECCAVSTTT